VPSVVEAPQLGPGGWPLEAGATVGRRHTGDARESDHKALLLAAARWSGEEGEHQTDAEALHTAA